MLCRSWAQEGNTVTFMAPEGSYEASLLCWGPDLDLTLLYVYNGTSWAQEGETGGNKGTLALQAGETLTLSPDGLERVDSAVAGMRMQSLLG